MSVFVNTVSVKKSAQTMLQKSQSEFRSELSTFHPSLLPVFVEIVWKQKQFQLSKPTDTSKILND